MAIFDAYICRSKYVPRVALVIAGIWRVIAADFTGNKTSSFLLGTRAYGGHCSHSFSRRVW